MSSPSPLPGKPRTTLPYAIAKVFIVITAPFLLIASGYIGFIAMFSCYGKADCNSLLEGGVYVFPAAVFCVLAWTYYEVRRRLQLVRSENMRQAVYQELGRPANPFGVDQLVLEVLQARGPLAQSDVMQLAGIQEDAFVASVKRLLDQRLVRQQMVGQRVVLSPVPEGASSPSSLGH